MPLDATARHVFAYGGAALQMADEHTLVAVAGNVLQFTSTVTHSQHFLLRAKPRRLLAFDVNWRNSEIAVTAREPDPEILVYSYPDKKLRGRLQHGAAMEYALLKYSRCGRRLLTVRADDDVAAAADNGDASPVADGSGAPAKRLCVWDMEKFEPLKGCGNASVPLDVAFASFDPCDSDHFLLGGDDGLQLWKIYKGKASHMLRHVTIKLTHWTSMGAAALGGRGPPTRGHTSSGLNSSGPPVASSSLPPPPVAAADAQDLEEKRRQFVCHAWMRHGRVLVANRAGELVVVDTAATVGGSELAGAIVEGATRENRCAIAAVVYTSETIVVAYADGHIAWLAESSGELLQATTLPCYAVADHAQPSAAILDTVAASTASVVATMAPSPNYSKLYVGTVDGHIYEIKASVATDEEDDLDEEVAAPAVSLSATGAEDPSLVASRLISSCGFFHRGPVLAAAALTPSGGSPEADLVVASGGADGRVYLWSVGKCRGVGGANLLALFAVGASALIAPAAAAANAVAGGSGDAASTAPGDRVVAPSGSPSTTAGASGHANSSPPSAASPRHAGGSGSCEPSVVITALAARAADPVLLVGDHTGRLRALCVTKVVGGGGALEFLPLHSVQLLPPQRALDVIELHPTQPFALAASTGDGLLFVLSLDHERRFAALAYVALPDERVVDVKWSVPPHSPAALSFTFSTTNGRLYLARYQDNSAAAAAAATPPLPTQLKPKVIAYGESLVDKCAAMRFLSDAPVNVLLAAAPTSGELVLLKYADLVIDPNEKVPLETKVLAPDAHEPPGVAALAVLGQRLRGGEQLVATAGVTGAVTLWMLSFSGSSALQTSELHLEDVQAAKKKTLVPHLGAVTSLSFVTAGDDLYLVTTGADGCVFLLDVRISSDMATPARPEPVASALYLNVANYAKYEDPFKPEQDAAARPLLSVVQDELEAAARNRFDRLKDKTRAQLNDLEIKLKILLAENDKLPESERLARDEFVVNTEWRDKLLRQNDVRARAVRDAIQRDLAKMAIVRERMKLEFWDSASVPGVRLRGLAPPAPVASMPGGASPVSSLFVYNFPMRRQPRHEVLRMQRIKLLRLVEYEHQRTELQAAATTKSDALHHHPTRGGVRGGVTARNNRGGTPDAASAGATEETSLARFHEVVPPNLQWLIDAGVHHPSLNRWINDKLKATAATIAVKDGKSEPAASGASALLAPAAPATLADAKSFHLVYHPAAVRTRKQQRIQIQLLKSFVRFQLAEFNREFQELARLKEAKMDEIEAKNARILEIGAELGGAAQAAATSELFRPRLAPDEVAASILEVSPDEMTQTPYESEDARRAREREAAERAELERQRQKDDVAGRALKDMMDGTLEVKKDNLVNQTLVKEPWMLETPVDEMTAEQKKLLVAFEAAQQKLKEEQEKYKKSLDLELKKTKAEIQDVCRAFDDKLRALQDVAQALKTSVLVQQLYELRLAGDLLEHEHLGGERRKMEATAARLARDIRVCEKENELFAAQVEACKDEWHRAADEDKAHERSFLRELEDALAAQGVAVEHELVKHLVELYKKRKAEDVRVAYGAGGGGGGGGAGGGGAGGAGPKRGKSNMHLNGNTVPGGSKNRLLAEAAGEQSSRTLTAATLLQNLQASASSMGGNAVDGSGLDGEANLDPFLGVEMPSRSAASSSATSSSTSMTRHVVPLDYEVDRPDGLLIDDRVWRTLNELRTKKVLAEHTVRDKAEQFAAARAVGEELHATLEELRDELDELRVTLASTARQLEALAENAPLLVHIKQGQDETGVGDEVFRRAMAMAAAESDALLVARASVESLNDVIQLHGKDQVGVLGRIKNFRKNINVMEWEHALLEMQTRDMEERYTDTQLLRVTKELQELFHTGDTSEKQKRELALLEAKMDHLGRHHQTHLLKLDAAQAALERQLRARARENDAFAAQAAQLETQVQIREDILLSRKSAALRGGHQQSQQQAAGEGSSADRLKAITVRRKLVDLARAQTEEIEFLRMELDKMRRRTFPTFAQQHAAAASHGGGVDSLY